MTVPRSISDQVGWQVGQTRQAVVRDGLLYIDHGAASDEVGSGIELRERNQITVPARVVRILGLVELHHLDVSVEGARIVCQPKIVLGEGIKRQIPVDAPSPDKGTVQFEPSSPLAQLARRGKRALTPNERLASNRPSRKRT